MKNKFNYGNYIISYRKEKDGLLHFLTKKIDALEDALKEHHKLQDLGYYDVLIKKFRA
jgi:hypothetical protein